MLIDEEAEREHKIKTTLEALKVKYKGKILTDKEYLPYQKEKIEAMKKDQIVKGTLGYFQVISQAKIIDDPRMLFKEFFERVYTRSRKLSPIRVKQVPVNIKKMEKIKIIKGYNIPIRSNSLPQKKLDEKKPHYLGYNPLENNLANVEK